MKAVGYRQPLPISEAESLIDVDLPEPRPSGRDLLVQVKAVSVNPVDTKIRRSTQPDADVNDGVKVLGYDAAAAVVETGPDAKLFKGGDRVWYAGAVQRLGTNAELHVVDERIVGKQPESLEDPQAAAMPLTTITAWELLFERLGVQPIKAASDESLLVIGAAGGVGSMLVQIAARLTGITVIATASREETAQWVRERGAHHVIDHSKPLSDELGRIGIPQVTHVASLTHTGDNIEEIVKSLAPQGRLGVIDDPEALDATQLKSKCLSLHWELMFTRSKFQTPDMIAQHRILTEAAALVDAGVLHTNFGEHYGLVNADNLKHAHAASESNKTKGKIVLEGF